MDFHAAMETFAEAWVAANTHTAVNSDTQVVKQSAVDDLPTQLPKEQLMAAKLSPSTKPAPTSTSPAPVQHSTSPKPTPVQQSTPPISIQHSPSSSAGTKSLPLHCIIEQTNGQPSFDVQSSQQSMQHNVELDSYAILPGTTLLSECVRAALIKLGYNATEAMGAKGAIQIKNWKALSFDMITDNKAATIDDMLGELTQVATLRIRICSQAKLSSGDEVKEKLLQLLLNQSHSLLASAGCPIEKDLLASISKGQNLASISPDVRRAFDRWYTEQLKLVKTELRPDKVSTNNNSDDRSPKPMSPRESQSSPPRPLATSTPTQSHYLPGKTRMRTSFDPEHEIPRLQKWFSENQHPSREQMLHYLSVLNLLDSRKGRRPLDLTNIIYWFKNARAAHRRANKSNEDDSFEIDEVGGENQLGSAMEGLPYLPNRNAIYMVPYPLHPALAGQPNLQNGHTDCKEPCDLSLYRKSNTTLPKPPSPNDHHSDTIVPKPAVDETSGSELSSSTTEVQQSPAEGDVKREEEPEAVPSPASAKETETESNNNAVNEADDHCQGDLDVKPEIKMEVEVENEQPKDLTNGVRDRESEGEDEEDMESDYDDRSINDDSLSSHEEGQLKKPLEQTYMGLGHGGGHLPPMTTSPSSQPLHIPQFPHPLAMHYFPLNTHLYSQQANALKFHNHHHHLHNHSSQQQQPQTPKSGQENSHRKRRTRVFIDPLSEIPKLEKWFIEDTHPSAYMIDKYCEELNCSEYRQKFPRLEPKNVQLWFKNHRAKVKRMRLSQGDSNHVKVFE